MLKDKLIRKEAALRSFEQEIQTLNHQIELLQRELKSESNISSREGDTIMTPIPIRLKKAEIKQLESVLAQLEIENKKTQNDLQEKTESLSVFKEKLTVMEVTMRNKGGEVAGKVETTLGKLQYIWKEMGASDRDRESIRMKIESCLEDTCCKILEDAMLKKESTRNQINILLKTLKNIYYALGKSEEFDRVEQSLKPGHRTFQRQLEFLQKEHQKIMPFYNITLNRLISLADEVRILVAAMEIPSSKLSANLAKLMNLNICQNATKRRQTIFATSNVVQSDTSKDERAKKIKQVEEMMKALESDQTVTDSCSQNECRMKDSSTEAESCLGPYSLSESFIDECESELRKLKRYKSETMVANQISRDLAKTLSNEMHLQGRELLSLTIHSIKKKMKELPRWWNPEIAEEACRAITSRECIINAGSTYTKHLNIIRDSLESVASGRRALSTCLKTIIEEAHRALLETVEGDIDANNAYASFDKALARLPKLSREHISACLDEMNTLVAAVHDMSQSETEALTVVWQALNVSNSDRGQFWSDVNESAHQTSTNNDFEAVMKACAEDIEEWIIAAIKDSTKINRKLNDQLFKLSKIHQEVERLRSKQDAKSQIMSLDSELCILSSKLAEFEEKAGNKQRLVTKKVNSSSLLDEERFRKQMQSNFSSKLHTLVKLLNDWQSMEGKNFDEKMLSEDVNAFIRNPDECGDWIEKRTAFMHLKTVKQKARRTAIDDSSSNSNSPQSSTNSIDLKKTKSNRNQSLTRNSNKERLLESKENQVQRRPAIKSGNSLDKRSRSPTSQRNKKETSTFQQKRTLLKDKNNDKPIGFKQSESNKSTPKNIKRNLAIDATAESSSPILPFGQVLAKTPVLKENIRLQNRYFK